MKITLLVLAAGMGSRYGGLKQLDTLGPQGETLMDYTIYDALQAGFEKVVFVIRKEMQPLFDQKIAARYRSKIEIVTVYQSITLEGLSSEQLAQRRKPWGTGHAVLCAAEVLSEPFAVVNADDYYGRQSLVLAADFLRTQAKAGVHGLISFPLIKTLSPHGAVTRGVCTTDADGKLQSIMERSKIFRQAAAIGYEEEGKFFPLTASQAISMNLWGFHPSILAAIGEAFTAFLMEEADNAQAEFYLPVLINDLLAAQRIQVNVMPSDANWMGLTYAADRAAVQTRFAELHRNAHFPSQLW